MNSKHSMVPGFAYQHARPLLGTGQRQRAVAARTPYWLFVLFAGYGPAVNFLGQWRYLELVLLALLVVNFQRALSCVGKLERRFIWLFALTAFMQVIADLYNDVLSEETLKRTGTYVVMIAIIIAVQWLSRNDPRRIALMLAGFSLSWLLLLFIGSDINEAYALVPWRLGLGIAATLFLGVVFAMLPRLHHLAGPAFLLLAGVHVVMNARSLAAVTAVTGILVIVAHFRNNRMPAKFRPGYFAAVFGLAIAVAFIGMQGLKWAVDNKMLPEEVQAKMELQMSHPYGLLAAGRGATVTAIYAISKRPFLGYGTTAYDADVFGFHAEMSALNYDEQGRFKQMLEYFMFKEQKSKAIPSHSHIFGAWADAGILAAISWIAFLGLAIYVLSRAMFWRNAWAPMFVYVSLSTIWDVLFSPGPTRLVVAMYFMVFVFAVHLFRGFDRTQQDRRNMFKTGNS